MNILESLPDHDKPLMFGLPSNIERSWQKTVSAEVIIQLQGIAYIAMIYDWINRKNMSIARSTS